MTLPEFVLRLPDFVVCLDDSVHRPPRFDSEPCVLQGQSAAVNSRLNSSGSGRSRQSGAVAARRSLAIAVG